MRSPCVTSSPTCLRSRDDPEDRAFKRSRRNPVVVLSRRRARLPTAPARASREGGLCPWGSAGTRIGPSGSSREPSRRALLRPSFAVATPGGSTELVPVTPRTRSSETCPSTDPAGSEGSTCLRRGRGHPRAGSASAGFSWRAGRWATRAGAALGRTLCALGRGRNSALRASIQAHCKTWRSCDGCRDRERITDTAAGLDRRFVRVPVLPLSLACESEVSCLAWRERSCRVGGFTFSTDHWMDT